MKHVLVAATAAIFGAGVALAFGALSVVPRMETLEHEAGKGERWTLQQQLDYMERHNAIHKELVEKLAAICQATDADC